MGWEGSPSIRSTVRLKEWNDPGRWSAGSDDPPVGVQLGERRPNHDWMVCLNRTHTPINMIDAFPNVDFEPPKNTLAVSVGDSFQDLLELGSKGETHRAPIYFDFYGESDGVTRHLVGDIYLRLNRDPVIPIYDYDLATPAIDFYAQVVEESVEKTYPSRATNAWQKHWGIVTALIEDDRENA